MKMITKILGLLLMMPIFILLAWVCVVAPLPAIKITFILLDAGCVISFAVGAYLLFK